MSGVTFELPRKLGTLVVVGYSGALNGKVCVPAALGLVPVITGRVLVLMCKPSGWVGAGGLLMGKRRDSQFVTRLDTVLNAFEYRS